MSGRSTPLVCCDGECAAANGCHVGGYRCDSCGLWYCIDEMTFSPTGRQLCARCSDEVEQQKE